MEYTDLNRTSPFSYQCQCCNKCCHNKLIQVNPYELLHIAQCLCLSTTAVLDQFVQTELPYLKQKPDGSCIFLGEHGCQIHGHRPGVCRIYPLGRLKDENQQEYFIELEPATGSKGIYGREATVGDYIEDQKVESYFVAGAKCLVLQHRIVEASKTEADLTLPDGFGDNMLDWLDVDQILNLAMDSTISYSLEEKLNRYTAILEQWLIHSESVNNWEYHENKSKSPYLT